MTYPRTCEVLESLGIDSNLVPAFGHDESGYLILGRHADGRLVLTTPDAPEMSRVPWPTPDAYARFERAMTVDVLAESPVVPSTEAAAVLRAADWLDARRDQTWNGGTRRPSNFGRAAVELRGYARDLMKGASQ